MSGKPVLLKESNSKSEHKKSLLDTNQKFRETRTSDLGKMLGIGSSTARTLVDCGYDTVEKLAATPTDLLVEKADIHIELADNIIKKAKDYLDIYFETADKLLEQRKELRRLTTGSQALDELLQGGGFEMGGTIELFGEFRTGKTQMCHQACVTVQLPLSKGGFREEGKELGSVQAVYIDTENTYRPERIVQMCIRYGLDPQTVLKNIMVKKAFTSSDLIEAVKRLETEVEKKNIKLIVIDNLTTPFPVYAKKSFERICEVKFHELFHRLTRLAAKKLITVILTNRVKDQEAFDRDHALKVPVGGDVVGHGSQTRIHLKEKEKEKSERIALIYDSPLLPEGEAIFCIKKEGICDVDRKNEPSSCQDSN